MDQPEKLTELATRIKQVAEDIAKLKETIDRLLEETERRKQLPEPENNSK